MEAIILQYNFLESKILQSLECNGIKHRSKASSGLWLGSLIGLSAALTLLMEDSSYSEICLLVGLTGFGLITSCLCLYSRLVVEKAAIKDFHAIYFLPSIITSMLYLLVANKGLLTSVAWGLSAGSLGTWGVVQLLANFPYCFTIGEATAVMHGGILFLSSVVTNLSLRYYLPPIHDVDIATVLLQVWILYVISICLLCGYFSVLRSTRYFYTVTSVLLLFIIPMLYILLDQDPVTWVLIYVFDKSTRIMLVIYWLLCLLLSVFVITYQILTDSQATTSIRKTFHLLAVFVYIPGILYEATLLYLASGIIMGLFMYIELMRILKIPPLGNILQQGFAVFADEKDILISLTPLYLLCGLSFPIWMPTNNTTLLLLLSGVLTVGVGDTAASIVGSRWGKHKWPGLEKSIEGTIACISWQFVVICALVYIGDVGSQWLFLNSIPVVVAVSLIEAYTDQVDNLALPLLMYMCLII